MPAKRRSASKKAKPARRKQPKSSKKPAAKSQAPAGGVVDRKGNGGKRSDLCPACGSDNVIINRERGETFCKDCKEIFAELDPEDEERYERASGVI